MTTSTSKQKRRSDSESKGKEVAKAEKLLFALGEEFEVRDARAWLKEEKVKKKRKWRFI